MVSTTEFELSVGLFKWQYFVQIKNRFKFQSKNYEEQKLSFDMTVSCKKGYTSLSLNFN